jgi:phosphoadenosine phosphosulfate reductase
MTMTNDTVLDRLRDKFKYRKTEEILSLAYQEFAGTVTFASSLGEEDQVITHMIAEHAPQIPIFTLDTGRLFPETYTLLEHIQKRYSLDFTIYYPDTQAVEAMVKAKGINLFYESIENRKLCCQIRKMDPLKRALAGKKAWICGLRRAQALTRQTIEVVEWDAGNGLVKINPLYNWSMDQLQDYIHTHQIEVNPLHVQGFVSIGCACCTRAIKPGEDIRAGRWWWEQPESKECGLHRNPNQRFEQRGREK